MDPRRCAPGRTASTPCRNPESSRTGKWPSLIEEYPGRFVIGSDTVGFFDQYKPTLQRYYLLLDALKPETARKVAHDNFLALLPDRKSTRLNSSHLGISYA